MLKDNGGQLLGIIGIVIGILVSYYFYRKSLREKAPYWAISSNNLIRGYASNIQDFKVSFEGKHVKNLTISKILFWNEGKETIKKDDIETKNHIRIIPKNDISIFNAEVLVSNNNSSQFSIQFEKNKNCASINFDYLDKNQGGVIQVIHTGTSSRDLEIIGDIKGVKSIYQRTRTSKWEVNLLRRISFSSKIGRIAGIVAIVLGIIYFVVGIIGIIQPSNDFVLLFESFNCQKNMTTYIIMMVLSMIIITMGYFMMRFSRTKSIAPKGLEIFDKD